MILVGFSSLDPSNLTPMIPPEFGVSGVLRGATSGFFGFTGKNEVCILVLKIKENKSHELDFVIDVQVLMKLACSQGNPSTLRGTYHNQ